MGEPEIGVWAIRAMKRESTVRVVARQHAWELGRPLSFDPLHPLPNSIEMLAGALANELIGTLALVLTSRRHTLHDAEVKLKIKVQDPLIWLGVQGETGAPRIESITGQAYFSATLPSEERSEIWGETLARSPILATLSASAEVSITVAWT